MPGYRAPSFASRVWDWFRTYHWLVVLLPLTAATLVCGYIGIGAFCADVANLAQEVCTSTLTPPDKAYLTLQLFTWESGGLFLGPESQRTLSFARLSAPLVVGYAAVGALLLLFADQVQPLRALIRRRHVIVCGLGEHGLTMAAGFRAAGWGVVILEQDPRNPFRRTARSYGPVITGTATDRLALRRAGVRRAEHLVAVCGHDSVNAEVAAHAAAERTTPRRILTCHVRVANPALWERLRPREITSSRGGTSRFQFFNTDDLVAREIAATVTTPPALEGRGPHLLLLGLESVNRRVLLHAARAWRLAPPADGLRLPVTVIEPAAGARLGDLVREHPPIQRICALHALDAALSGPALPDLVLGLARGELPPSLACVDAHPDDAAVTVALAAADASPSSAFPIVVCASRERGVSVLMTDAAPAQADRIRVVGLLEQGCTPQHVLNGTNELLARAIHEAYLTTQAAVGHTRASNESMVPWEALPESLRESNRRQADHIVRQLEDRQCTVAPLRDWDEPIATFTKAEIEQLARAEHERWMTERALLGWTYAAGVEEKTKRVGQKRSPYLVEWDLLPPEIRRIDYEAVEAIPAHLARVGLGVYRRETVDVSDGSSELALS